jgi:uncharacterized protein (DUF927 family)
MTAPDMQEPELPPNAADATTAPDLAAIVANAAALSELEYQTQRKAMAQRGAIGAGALDRLRAEAIRARRRAEAEAERAAAEEAQEAEAVPPPGDLAAEIAALAAMPAAEYAAARADAAARLRMTRRDLDRAVNTKRGRQRAEREAAARSEPPPAPGAVRWPVGVRVQDDGLYVDAGDDAPPSWLAAPFTVIGEARSADGTGWARWLRWRDRDGRVKAWLMPNRLLMVGPGELEAELVDRGLLVSADPGARLHLRRALAEVQAGTLVTAVSRAGWHATPGAASAYVLPSGDVIGETGEPLVMSDPGEEAAARCAVAGTLEGWQAGVAAKAIGNPLAAFAISCAFAGPLLLPAAEVSGGFHLAGGSKAGKTTACQMGATAWGPPQKGAVLRDWNSTANAIEATAEEAGDGFLILDEIHQADPRAVTGAVYALAGEGGKSRLTRDAKARKRRTWRTFILSNGEIDLGTVAAKAGQRLPAGAAVRLPSIPVDKSGAAWPALHGADSFGALMADLHAAMRQHHGHAAPAFINRLAETWANDPGDIGALLDDRRAHFAGCLPADADAQARDVARRFALVAAAGEMATEWGILPWPEGEATSAAEAMMRAWLATRGGAGAAEDNEALERVRRFIGAYGDSRFPESLPDGGEAEDAGRAPPIRAGYRKTVAGSDCFLFFPEIWAGEMFAGADAINGAKALLRAGYLVPGEAGKLQRNERVPGFKRAVRFYAVRGAIMEAETGEAP